MTELYNYILLGLHDRDLVDYIILGMLAFDFLLCVNIMILFIINRKEKHHEHYQFHNTQYLRGR